VTKAKTTTRTIKAAPDIVKAMNSKALFEPWYQGESWDGWKALLKAALALPMTDSEAEFFRSVAERDPPTKRVREFWIIAGRRGGKDSIASVIAAHAAAFFAHSDRLRPGERALVLNLATDRAQAAICLNYVRGFFSGIPMLKAMVERETRDGFELANHVDIAIGTNDYRAVRGRAVLAAILDECAFYQSDTSSSPDVETYRALVPGLATLPGSMLIGISSPYRKSGLLYDKFRANYGKPGDVLVIRAPSKLLNPTLDQAIIDQALADDPFGARSEWLAEFRSDISGFLDLEVVESSVDRGVTVRPPRKDANIVYRSGCDPSGGSRDSFTCAISHQEGGFAVLDCIVEVKAPFNPTSATEQIASTLKSYGITETVGDKYAAQWVVDAFAKCGIKYRHSDRDRSAIYADALPLFTSGKARLLDNARLVNQFASLERKTSSLGRDKIDHGPGGHDDLCNSAALALVLAAVVKPEMKFVPPFYHGVPRNIPGSDTSWASGPPGGWRSDDPRRFQ
jgi:hypothetical protein